MPQNYTTRREALLALPALAVGFFALTGCCVSKTKRRPHPGHYITKACTRCGSCIDSCPVEAIKEATPKYTIDRDTCIDCGACVDECPVSAIRF